jgi:hypothetical protein
MKRHLYTKGQLILYILRGVQLYTSTRHPSTFYAIRKGIFTNKMNFGS